MPRLGPGRLLGASLKGDYTAGPKLGRLADDRYIIADVVRDRLESHQRDALLKNTADRDGRGRVKQSIPQDPGQAGKSQVQSFALLLAGHNVHFSPETGDKVTRATPLASQINVGNVMLLRGAWNTVFIDECRLFPNSTMTTRSTKQLVRSMGCCTRRRASSHSEFASRLLRFFCGRLGSSELIENI